MKLFSPPKPHAQLQVNVHRAQQLANKLQAYTKVEHGEEDMGDMLIALLLCAEACAGTLSTAPWMTLRSALDALQAATEDDEQPLPEAKA